MAADDGEFSQAIDQFTAAIELNRTNYTLYSNRSAAYIRLGRFAEALEDAKKTLELKPDWPKVCCLSVDVYICLTMYPICPLMNNIVLLDFIWLVVSISLCICVSLYLCMCQCSCQVARVKL